MEHFSDKDVLFVSLYVDDMIYMSSSSLFIKQFHESMSKELEISDLGLLHYFLGMEVKQVEGGIFISQKKYAIYLLKRFHMSNCKIISTPMNPNENLQVEDGTESANKQMYISLVGGTGLNIAFSVGVISRFMHFPSKHHSRSAKRILRYVVGMVDYGIWFKYMSYSELIGVHK